VSFAGLLIPQVVSALRQQPALVVIERVVGNSSGVNETLTFSAIPGDGERIVIAATVSSGTLVLPITQIVRNSAGTNLAAIGLRVAASESSATYTLTNSSANVGVVGWRLSAGAAGATDTNNTSSSTTSLAASATGVTVPDNSLVIAAFAFPAAASTGGWSVSNSFTLRYSNDADRSQIADRLYTTGGSAQSTTLSWTSSRNCASAIAVITP